VCETAFKKLHTIEHDSLKNGEGLPAFLPAKP
jgi:hypothetical protein